MSCKDKCALGLTSCQGIAVPRMCDLLAQGYPGMEDLLRGLAAENAGVTYVPPVVPTYPRAKPCNCGKDRPRLNG